MNDDVKYIYRVKCNKISYPDYEFMATVALEDLLKESQHEYLC